MTIANRNRLLVAATLLWLLASLLASEGMFEDLFSAQAADPFTEEPTTEKTVEKEIRDRPAEPSSPAESYGQTIRTSAWRSPAEELAGFHVPPGFQVELVASEPEIAKPMNLAFDARGRLWLTQSTLYPFPAKQEPAKQESGGNDQASPNSTTSGDAIVILEDRDRDGRYEKKTTFADGLNIPIGLLPYADGAIVFSIPNLYFLRDTDGDGICDERKVLLGPFDTTRDTHGMVNALRDGGDGWIYACHGFNNVSKIQGTDGHAIEMTSGNIFRFKPDGSRVELYTQGQVNPFGMTKDKYGFWFTADCHSKPITQLLRGGCYPSFGRPHDGLGFVPPTMEHLHGSTAISGVAYVGTKSFPSAYQGNLLSGNVMTCRVNRNRLDYYGATAKANEMPDLLTSDDTWFRPVDLQFGPDGALYVADFYNKIIGHYEVPLDHPDRDRKSGRIWRIRYVGTDNPSQPSEETKPTDSGKGPDTEQAILRLRAVERLGEEGSVEDASRLMRSIPTIDDRDAILKQAHWIAIRDILARAVKRSDQFPESLLSITPSSSDPSAELESQSRSLLKVLQAVRDPSATRWSLQVIETIGPKLPQGWETGWLRESLLSVATMASEEQVPRVLGLIDQMVSDPNARAEQVLLIAESQKQRTGKLTAGLVELGQTGLAQTIEHWLGDADRQGITLRGWTGLASRGRDMREWPKENRSLDRSSHPQSDKQTKDPVPFWSSLGLSERYMGTWTSSPFPAPATLGFWIVGHNGFPNEPDRQENFVRILASDPVSGDWQEFARVFPPRSDIAKWVSIDLSGLSSDKRRMVRVQVVDDCGLDAYAWIGIAGLTESGLADSPARDQLQRILRLVKCFGPFVLAKERGAEGPFGKQWERLITSDRLDPLNKASLQAWVEGQEQPVLSELVSLIAARGMDDLLAQQGVTKEGKPWSYSWTWRNLNPDTIAGLAETFGKRANAPIQEELVLRWSKHRGAYPLMESLIRRGALSKDTLRVLPASWWDGLPAEESARFAELKPEGETDTARATVVQNKATAISKLAGDLAIGKRVYEERCATCHQLRGQGKVIGPQLDGAVVRTVERLCEDILWPNRNVDEAFRITNVLMQDGETVSGLILDRTDSSLEVIDQAGKSQRVVRADIEQEKISKLSLMPGNFEELLTDAELAGLIGYLKSQGQK